MKNGTPLTYEERKNIKSLLNKGLSCGQIAQKINRSKNGIVHEIRRNGGKDNYDPQIAHTGAKQRNLEKKQKLSLLFGGKKKNTTLTQRITNLEMQLEILHDVIKGLLNGKN